MAAKFCVALYFFLGGYGLFIRWRKRELSVADSVFTLYKAYWKVFAIFIPAGYLLFSRSGEGINPLCTRFVINDAESLITTIVSNLTGWSSSLNGEWWFFGSYLCAIPMGYLFCCAIERRQNLWADLFLVFGIDILISGFFPSVARVEAFAPLAANVYYSRFLTITGMASTFFAGIVSAKYDLIRRLKVLLCETPLSLPLCCLGTAVLYWYRTFISAGSMDILYCILIVPMLSVILDRLRPLKRFFGFLGKHSTNMWLTHSFFAYYFLEATYIVYATPNVWVDLAILIAMSLGASVFLNWFWDMGMNSAQIVGKKS